MPRTREAGVARNCHDGKPRANSPLAEATDCADFEMVSGGTGQVYRFASEDVFSAVLRTQQGKELAAFVARSKHGVAMQQGYVTAMTIVLLSEKATEADEDATRVALRQAPAHAKP